VVGAPAGEETHLAQAHGSIYLTAEYTP
jgi:hypothetical protein